MKKIQSAATLKANPQAWWHRWGAIASLLCVLASTPPLHAQDPSSNQATLNFVGADIDSVIKAVGHYTNTTFIIDPRVKGTINLVSEKPVNKTQALNLLASALRLQGYALVRVDGFTKVVPEADAKLQAGPAQADQVRGDQIATQIFRLNYESAVNLVPVLRPLISPNNTVSANPGSNSLVITDYADNLRRLARIIASLDVPAPAGLEIVPVKYAIASDLAVMVNRLLEQGGAAAPGAAADAGRLTVLADPRTNSVIVRAPSAARGNLAKSLVAKLDQPTSQPGNVHVVHLRNADAVKLAQTLRAVMAGEAVAPGTGSQPTTQQASMLGQQGQQGQGGGGLTAGGALTPSQQQAALPTGGPGGFIQADPATNTLIITASETVYRNLRMVIDLLDARRAQVYVESLIVEISANKAAEFGIQWLGLSGDATSRYRVGGGTAFTPQSGGNNIIAQAAARAADQAAPLPGNGLTVGVFRQIGGKLGLGALARALEADSNVNILSVPNLITLDNEEARIIVGENVPFITGQFTTQASGGAAGVNPFQTIERRDVGLALRVRPQISEGGTIKLQIYHETSAVTDRTNISGLITSKRSIESSVLVDDGEIIVLGGLIEDKVSDGVEKVPGLGDIPVLGNLFKYQNRSRVKTNLMVFLRPTVIRTAENNDSVVTDRYEYMRGVMSSQQPAQTPLLPDMPAPMLPPLIDGRPAGTPWLNIPPRQPEGLRLLPPAGASAPDTPVPQPAAAPAPGTPAPPPDQNQSRPQ